MLKFFCSLVVLVAVFHLSQGLARDMESSSLEDYVYDHEGNPLFVKVYLPHSRVELLNRSARSSHLSSGEEEKICVLNRMVHEDEQGSFLIVPIKKKKKSTSGDDDSDKDEDTWDCPYCGIDNPASKNTCRNPECPLYRKKGRDW